MSDKPAWLVIAEEETGVHETPGPEATRRILEYFKATTLTATNDEVPWCSAFINWCVTNAGFNGTHSARAISWINWGVALKKPQLGCIVVFAHHVGLWLGETETSVNVFGGNQSDKVGANSFNKANVLGYRWLDPKKVKRGNNETT